MKNRLHNFLSEGKFCFSNSTNFYSLRHNLNFWELLKLPYVSFLSIDHNFIPLTAIHPHSHWILVTHQRTIRPEWVLWSIRIYTAEKELQNSTSGSFVQHGSYKLRAVKSSSVNWKYVNEYVSGQHVWGQWRRKRFQALVTENE